MHTVSQFTAQGRQSDDRRADSATRNMDLETDMPHWLYALYICLLLNRPLVYFRDGSAQTILRAATLRQKLQIKAFHLTQSQYTDTGPTSPRVDPITPGAWQGSPLECQCLSHWYDSTLKEPSASQVHTEISRSRGGRLRQGHRCALCGARSSYVRAASASIVGREERFWGLYFCR